MAANEVTKINSEIDSMKTVLNDMQTTDNSIYNDLKLLTELVESNEKTAAYSINKSRVDLIKTVDFINTTLDTLGQIMTEKDDVLSTLIESNKTIFKDIGEINAAVSTLTDNVHVYKKY